MTIGRAKRSLASAEALATRMGAPECAVRPFPDQLGGGYVPSNSGLRFSTNASTPSWKSWVCCRSP